MLRGHFMLSALVFCASQASAGEVGGGESEEHVQGGGQHQGGSGDLTDKFVLLSDIFGL